MSERVYRVPDDWAEQLAFADEQMAMMDRAVEAGDAQWAAHLFEGVKLAVRTAMGVIS